MKHGQTASNCHGNLMAIWYIDRIQILRFYMILRAWLLAPHGLKSFIEVNQHLGELGWMMSERSEALRATDTIHLEKACPLRDHCTNPQITTRTCSITEDQGICDLTYALHKGPNAQLRDQKGWHQHDLLVCQVSSNFGNNRVEQSKGRKGFKKMVIKLDW